MPSLARSHRHRRVDYRSHRLSGAGRNSAGISMQAYFVWLSAAVLLLIHALMINDAVSILLQSLATTLDLTSVVLGTKYRGKMCPLHRVPRHRREQDLHRYSVLGRGLAIRLSNPLPSRWGIGCR